MGRKLKNIEELIRALTRRGGLLLIYGGGGTGKTTLALQLLLSALTRGWRSLYAYTGRLSSKRFKSLAQKKLENLRHLLILIRLVDFDDQDRAVDALYRSRGEKLKVAVFDTFTGLYRSFVAETKNPLKASKLLNQQLAMLAELANSFNLNIILTSRARRLAEDLEPEASSLLEYWANTIIRIEKLERLKWRRITVEKGPPHLEGWVIEAEMTGKGLR